MKDEDAFWMVWNPRGHAPTHRHESEREANVEAERLASANPGERFYVLKAERRYQKVDVERVDLLERIPF